MATIIVKTQAEWDALPAKFDAYTVIEIRSEKYVWIHVDKAWGNSTVKALGNSTVKALGNSTVEAWGNSTVEAWDSSTVEAWDSSTVKALGNSTVEAWDSSTVEAWGNSTVKALGNSTVKALGNSTVEAWDSSQITLFLSSYVIVLSAYVIIKKLLDHSTAVFKGCPIKIEEKSETAHAREIPSNIDVSFEEWLRRGYVVADGISKKLKSQKKVGEIEVFECEDFPKKTTSYVVKRGDTFSHGETVEKAIEDLRYKIGNRDTSEFESWTLKTEVSIDEAIQSYRVITGACEFGTKQFCSHVELPEKITISEIIKKTAGQFGNTQYAKFFEERA